MLTLISFLLTHAGMITTGAFVIASLIVATQKKWLLCFAFLCMSLFMGLNYFPPVAYVSIKIIETAEWIAFALYLLLMVLFVKLQQVSSSEIDLWSKLQAKGKRHFVLIHAGLYGLLMFVPLYIGLFTAHEAGVLHYSITVSNMIITSILSLIGGVFFGLALWSMLETRYKNKLTK